MPSSTTFFQRLRRASAWAALGLGLVSASGCTVIAVAGAATSVAVGAVSLAGSAIGTAVDIVTPSSSDKKK